MLPTNFIDFPSALMVRVAVPIGSSARLIWTMALGYALPVMTIPSLLGNPLVLISSQSFTNENVAWIGLPSAANAIAI